MSHEIKPYHQLVFASIPVINEVGIVFPLNVMGSLVFGLIEQETVDSELVAVSSCFITLH